MASGAALAETRDLELRVGDDAEGWFGTMLNLDDAGHCRVAGGDCAAMLANPPVVDTAKNDGTAVGWLSPSFSSFRFGASYVAKEPQPGSNFARPTTNGNDDGEGVWAVGLHMDRTFSGVRVRSSLSYQEPVNAEDTGAPGESWAASSGIKLTFDKLTVSGTGFYGEAYRSGSERIFSIGGGLMYEDGPLASTLSIMWGEEGFSVVGGGGRQEQLSGELGLNYDLGSGVRAVSSVLLFDSTKQGDDSMGVSAIGGLKLDF